MENVLISCAGKGAGFVAQIRIAMRQVPPLAGSRLLVTNYAKVTPAGGQADASFVLPPIAHPEYVDQLLAVCRRERVRIVLPLMDVDLDRLAPHLDRFAGIGTQVVCPAADLVELCFDKLAFHQFAQSESIPVPRMVPPAHLDAAAYPLFHKHRRGFGSIGSGVCRSPAAAREAIDRNPEVFFEECVQGPEISVDAYIASSGRQTIRVQRNRDKVIAGEVSQSHTVALPHIRDAASHALERLAARGLRGPVNLQLFDAATPLVFDVNTRLGSGCVLSNMATGGRLFRSVLMEACGLAADGDPDDYTPGLHLYRYVGDLFHDGNVPICSFP